MKILKDLFLKFVVICLSICLLVNTTAYGIPTLRSNSIFDKINEKEDKERVGVATNVVESKNAFKKKVRTVFESLRPDFSREEKLSVKEFEEYIGQKAKELGIEYVHIKSNTWNTIPINIMGMIQNARNRTWLGFFVHTLGLLTLTIQFMQTPLAKDKEVKEISDIMIESTGKFGFVTPMILLGTFVTVGLYDFLVFPIMSIILNLFLYSLSKRFLAHELEHAYITLLIHKLIKEKVVNITYREFNALMGIEDSFSLSDPLRRKYIDKNRITVLENKILEALADKFSSSVDIAGDLQTKPTSTEPIIDEQGSLLGEQQLQTGTMIDSADKNRNQL